MYVLRLGTIWAQDVTIELDRIRCTLLNLPLLEGWDGQKHITISSPLTSHLYFKDCCLRKFPCIYYNNYFNKNSLTYNLPFN